RLSPRARPISKRTFLFSEPVGRTTQTKSALSIADSIVFKIEFPGFAALASDQRTPRVSSAFRKVNVSTFTGAEMKQVLRCAFCIFGLQKCREFTLKATNRKN